MSITFFPKPPINRSLTKPKSRGAISRLVPKPDLAAEKEKRFFLSLSLSPIITDKKVHARPTKKPLFSAHKRNPAWKSCKGHDVVYIYTDRYRAERKTRRCAAWRTRAMIFLHRAAQVGIYTLYAPVEQALRQIKRRSLTVYTYTYTLAPVYTYTQSSPGAGAALRAERYIQPRARNEKKSETENEID